MKKMDKLEKHISQKFREREMPPSSKAWERIDKTLGVEKPPQSKRPLFWTVGVAAGLLVVVTLSISYWSTKETESQENIIVEGASENQVKKEVVTPATVAGQEEFDTPIPPNENATLVVEKEQQELTSDTAFSKTYHDKSGIAENQLETKSPGLGEIVGTENRVNAKIEDKLNEVLAQVTAMEDSQIAVTDAEIDSLLLAAQQELLLDKVMQENGKVDAMALLNEVEEELDQTFRDQLFDTLKEGFFKLRTAVADRNN